MEQHFLSRTELLIGKEGLNKLKNSKVCVFGIGGVGSFVVEALVRAGVGKIIMVDNDTVSLTNLNRQIHATMDTINKPKVQVMKDRILSINPKCEVTIHQIFVKEENIGDIIEEDVDYVVDAIDTVSSKLALAVWCDKREIRLISSMGTGNKFDPTAFKVADLYDTKVCPLAKVMRYELRKRGVKKLKVLYSEEMPIKPNEEVVNSKTKELCEEETKNSSHKKQTPGSISFVPPVAGMIIGGEVIKELIGMVGA